MAFARLDEVDPGRRDEVRRRIAILEEYGKAPSTKAAEAAADRIGIRVGSFYALARAWRETRDPTTLPGGARRRAGRGRVATLPADLEAIVAAAVAARPDAVAERLVDDIVAAARARGMDRPTRGALRNHVARLRAGWPANADVLAADYVVDHCLIDIPVGSPEAARVRPLATIVLDIARSAAVGIALTSGMPDAKTTARALLDAAPAVGLDGRSRVLLDRPADGGWADLAALLADCGLEVSGENLPVDAFAVDAGPLHARGNGRTAIRLLGKRALGTVLTARSHHLLPPVPPRAGDRRPAADIGEIETMLRARLRALLPTERRTSVPRADDAWSRVAAFAA